MREATILVRRKLDQHQIDLRDICHDATEFTTVTIHKGDCDTTIVSAYVRPGTCWDPTVITKIIPRCSAVVLFLKDFNAHNHTWVDEHTTTRGSALEATMKTPGLIPLYDETATFVRPGILNGVLDLCFATPNLSAR